MKVTNIIIDRIDRTDTLFFCVHTGSSMNPTLCGLDLLEIVPYGKWPVRVGDVILFLPPEEDQLVVHRIVRVTSKGICSRGDNSTSNDPWLLQPADISGRVVAVWRAQKRRRITGGWAGWLGVYLIRWQCLLVQRFFFPLLRPIYHFLVHRGIMHRLLPSRFRARIVIFQANGNSHLRLLLGRHVIGWYDAEQIQWYIQCPFRLFVDPKGFQHPVGF